VRVTRYRSGDRRYLVVDAAEYVPDRTAFAASHCDPVDGIAPPASEQSGLVHADQGVSGPRGGPGVAADGGPERADGAGASGVDGGVVGADGVLFLALEPEFHPPRVVMTVVSPDGGGPPCCTEGVRCAARWAAAGTDADRVMVDTQAGTRAARVHADGSVSVEVDDAAETGTDPLMERGAVDREFETDVEKPRP
jgi:diaminopimelate epimerase